MTTSQLIAEILEYITQQSPLLKNSLAQLSSMREKATKHIDILDLYNTYEPSTRSNLFNNIRSNIRLKKFCIKELAEIDNIRIQVENLETAITERTKIFSHIHNIRMSGYRRIHEEDDSYNNEGDEVNGHYFSTRREAHTYKIDQLQQPIYKKDKEILALSKALLKDYKALVSKIENQKIEIKLKTISTKLASLEDSSYIHEENDEKDTTTASHSEENPPSDSKNSKECTNNKLDISPQNTDSVKIKITSLTFNDLTLDISDRLALYTEVLLTPEKKQYQESLSEVVKQVEKNFASIQYQDEQNNTTSLEDLSVASLGSYRPSIPLDNQRDLDIKFHIIADPLGKVIEIFE